MLIIDGLVLVVLITIFIPVTGTVHSNELSVQEPRYGEYVGMR